MIVSTGTAIDRNTISTGNFLYNCSKYQYFETVQNCKDVRQLQMYAYAYNCTRVPVQFSKLFVVQIAIAGYGVGAYAFLPFLFPSPSVYDCIPGYPVCIPGYAYPWYGYAYAYCAFPQALALSMQMHMQTICSMLQFYRHSSTGYTCTIVSRRVHTNCTVTPRYKTCNGAIVAADDAYNCTGNTIVMDTVTKNNCMHRYLPGVY